jgi:hypothetical protein
MQNKEKINAKNKKAGVGLPRLGKRTTCKDEYSKN